MSEEMTETQALTESGVAMILRHLEKRGELKRREVQRLLGQKRRAAGVLDAVAEGVAATGEATKVAAPHGSWRLRWSLGDVASAIDADEAATPEQRRAAGPGPYRRADDVEGVVRGLAQYLLSGRPASLDQRVAVRQATTRIEEIVRRG